MAKAAVIEKAKTKASKPQTVWIGNGNEAVAQAIVQIGYDGEGYYPITPSSDAGEEVSKAFAAGKTDLAFIAATSELAAIGICTGMAVAGGRVVDITSANGLLLKAEEMPAISGLALPMVLNLSTRDVSAPLNIKNGHSDLAACLGFGWLILCAPTVQATYDLNIIAIKLAEAVNLPVIVAYDGFHTSHANRKIHVFADQKDVREFVGEKPRGLSIFDVDHPHTFGPYMNDDLINTKVQLDAKMIRAYEVLPGILKQFAEYSGRSYDFVERYGADDAEVIMVMINTGGETAKDAVDRLNKRGEKVAVVIPKVLRPFPEKELIEAVAGARTILVGERVSQYGATNYLANELGAALQRVGSKAEIIQRTYGVGGLTLTDDDAEKLFEIAIRWPNVDDPDEKRRKWYYGAWPGNIQSNPPATIEPATARDKQLNIGQDKVNLRELSEMTCRLEKHAACPGCGIFVNINLFLRGIDGPVVLLFNTGCGMVVTTGYPNTTFRVPYFHNLFHNASSTATGIVEMYKRFRKQGKIKEDITIIAISGDGGMDIGMDQVIGAALRNDPFIMLEYDNKGYMNTGAQMCYTGIKGQRNSNAHIGPQQRGKTTHHKDTLEILRGTHCSYLFQAAESQPVDMIRKARKAQQTAREGGFVYGRFWSTCPLNWGMKESNGPAAVKAAVDSCLFPLYEVEKGITTLNHDPEKRNKKVPVTDAFKLMGAGFSHMIKPDFADIVAEVQGEVDRRWKRLKTMADSDVL